MGIFYVPVPIRINSPNLAWAEELNQCFSESFTIFSEETSNGYYPNENDVLLFGWSVGVADFMLRMYLWKNKQSVPKVATIIHSLTNWRNDVLSPKLTTIIRYKDLEMLTMPDFLLFPSTYLKEKVVNLFPFLKGAQNNMAVTGLPMLARKQDLSRKKDILVFNQRISPERNFDSFCQFADAWLAKNPHWKVRILSKIPISIDFKRYNNVKDKFEILIPKSRSDYIALLEECRLTISFCTIETFGYSILEATQMGVKALLPNAGSYPELIKCPNNFYDKEKINDIQHLTERADSLLKLNDLTHSLDSLSKDYIITQFRKFLLNAFEQKTENVF